MSSSASVESQVRCICFYITQLLKTLYNLPLIWYTCVNEQGPKDIRRNIFSQKRLIQSVLTSKKQLLLPFGSFGMDAGYDVVIIGAGMGGLACGNLLAKEGMKVLICEQSYKVGGYCQNFEREQYTFTPGAYFLNEFGPGGRMNAVFEALGIPNELDFLPQNPLRRIITPYFEFTLSTDVDQFERDLVRLFPAEQFSIRAYIKECKKLVQCLDNFSIVSTDLLSIKEQFQLICKGITKGPRLFRYLGKSTQEVMDSYFRDPFLKYLLSFGTRKGCSFFACASPIMWAIKGDFYYIKDNGVGALPELFVENYKSQGGEILFNSPVKEIFIENGKARGVRLDGEEEILTRFVVSNCDSLSTFQDLIDPSRLPKGFLKGLKDKEISKPVFTLFLGVDSDLPAMGFDGSPICFYPEIGENPWEDMQTGAFNIEKGRIEIRMDSINNPLLAPEGKHIIVSSTYVPYDLFRDNDTVSPCYKEIKEEIAQNLIKLTERIIPNLSNNIEVMDASTPVTYERYTLNRRGASMGWYLSAEDVSRFRTQKTPVSNLFQAGHWTFPGGGVPMVLISGVNAGRLVLKNRKKFK